MKDYLFWFDMPGEHIAGIVVAAGASAIRADFETRIILGQIEHRIEPKQGRGERDSQSQWVRNRERLSVTCAKATILQCVQLLELPADYIARRDLN